MRTVGQLRKCLAQGRASAWSDICFRRITLTRAWRGVDGGWETSKEAIALVWKKRGVSR